MLRIEKILCPVDFSEYSLKAYEYAQSLAQHYGAKLLLQHVIQPLTSTYPYYAFPNAINEVFWNLENSAKYKLSELSATHMGADLRSGVSCIKGRFRTVSWPLLKSRPLFCSGLALLRSGFP